MIACTNDLPTLNPMFPRILAATKYAFSIVLEGRCPNGTEIKSLSGCGIAAQYLKLADTSATSDGQHSEYYSMDNHPPFCYYDQADQLKFNEGSNSGKCSKSDLCLCAGSGSACNS